MKRHTIISLLSCIISFPLMACEEAETKQGVITQLVSGDTACYVDIQLNDGSVITDMADFDICDQSNLLNKKVELHYEKGNVLAAECEGNYDCGKSDEVMLINKARILP